MTFSKVCSPPTSNHVRSSPKCAWQFQIGPIIKSSSSLHRALRWWGVFVAQYSDGVRVAVTGASQDGVFRWTEAEAALSAHFDASALDGLSVAADDLIADLHGYAEYRAHLIKVMTARAVKAA